MPRMPKVYFCKECGKQLPHKTRSGLCTECAIRHTIENAKQLKQKKGKYYKRWVQGMLAYANKLAQEQKSKRKK